MIFACSMGFSGTADRVYFSMTGSFSRTFKHVQEHGRPQAVTRKVAPPPLESWPISSEIHMLILISMPVCQITVSPFLNAQNRLDFNVRLKNFDPTLLNVPPPHGYRASCGPSLPRSSPTFAPSTTFSAGAHVQECMGALLSADETTRMTHN